MTGPELEPHAFDPLADSSNDGEHTEIDARDFARSVARCFSSPDGRRVLRHLRAITLDRSLAPGATDSMLRHLEGQRSLVVYLISLSARGSGSDGVVNAAATVARNPAYDPADL